MLHGAKGFKGWFLRLTGLFTLENVDKVKVKNQTLIGGASEHISLAYALWERLYLKEEVSRELSTLPIGRALMIRAPLRIQRLFLRIMRPAPRMLGDRVCVIGVHGWMPSGRVLKSVVGAPRGTSSRLASMMRAAILSRCGDFDNSLLSYFEPRARVVDEINLEGGGCVEERAEMHFKQIISSRTNLEKLLHADTIIFVGHSQGAPVSIILCKKLLDAGLLNNSNSSFYETLVSSEVNSSFGVDNAAISQDFSSVKLHAQVYTSSIDSNASVSHDVNSQQENGQMDILNLNPDPKVSFFKDDHNCYIEEKFSSEEIANFVPDQKRNSSSIQDSPNFLYKDKLKGEHRKLKTIAMLTLAGVLAGPFSPEKSSYREKSKSNLKDSPPKTSISYFYELTKRSVGMDEQHPLLAMVEAGGGVAARELFRLSDPNSTVSRAVRSALECLLSKESEGGADLKMVSVAAWMDQLVPLHSAILCGEPDVDVQDRLDYVKCKDDIDCTKSSGPKMFHKQSDMKNNSNFFSSRLDHPGIWRAIHIPEQLRDRLEGDFLEQLLRITCLLTNARCPGAASLLSKLSEPLHPPMMISAAVWGTNTHSSVYEDPAVYALLLSWLNNSALHGLCSNLSVQGSPSVRRYFSEELTKNNVCDKDYAYKHISREVHRILMDPRLSSYLMEDRRTLLKLFEEWKPERHTLRLLKLHLTDVFTPY